MQAVNQVVRLGTAAVGFDGAQITRSIQAAEEQAAKASGVAIPSTNIDGRLESQLGALLLVAKISVLGQNNDGFFQHTCEKRDRSGSRLHEGHSDLRETHLSHILPVDVDLGDVSYRYASLTILILTKVQGRWTRG